MVNWGAVSPIIVAIIGASGVIVPILINQLYNKPNIDIDIKNSTQEDPKNSTIITLSNIGTMPATNLSLIITAHNEIIDNITNVFSTVNVTLASPPARSISLLGIFPIIIIEIPKPPSLFNTNSHSMIKSRSAELHVDKFVNGDGSIIKLAVGAKDARVGDYIVYATYDQGSKSHAGLETDYPSLLIHYLPYIYLIVAEIIFTIYFSVWSVRWILRRRKRTFFEGIIYEIVDIRKELIETLSARKIFFDKYWKELSGFKRYSVPIEYKHRMIRNVNDYIRIDDFYSKLAERNSYINSCIENKHLIDDTALLKINKKCLELAEEVLEKIDWSRYE